MLPPLSRRSLLGGLVGSGLVWEAARAGATEEGAVRKFTMDLVCGNIGVRARLPEAIALAHKYGFESVAPDAGFLKSLSDGKVSELGEDLKAQEAGLGGGRPGGRLSRRGSIVPKRPEQAPGGRQGPEARGRRAWERGSRRGMAA